MINPTGKKLEKLLFGIFDSAIEGADRYNHNGSLWLIFTDEMRWVVEYTKSQTLWYNYYFFKQEMEIIGLDCVEDKDLIQKWFESRFLNMSEVQFADYIGRPHRNVYDTIQNGVKDTISSDGILNWDVEDTIQNGVKETRLQKSSNLYRIEDTIQEGVKQTELSKRDFFPEDIFQNGVKETKISRFFSVDVEDTIKNGVKHCEDGDRLDGDERFEDIIQNGVKEIGHKKTPD